MKTVKRCLVSWKVLSGYFGEMKERSASLRAGGGVLNTNLMDNGLFLRKEKKKRLEGLITEMENMEMELGQILTCIVKSMEGQMVGIAFGYNETEW